MRSRNAKADRFHPAFKECTKCYRIWPKQAYQWHSDGWQYGRCPDCRRAANYIRYERTNKIPWSPDDKTILILAHARGWSPTKVAAHLNRSIGSVKYIACETGLGPWLCYAHRRAAGSKAWRRVAPGEGLLGQQTAPAECPRAAAE